MVYVRTPVSKCVVSGNKVCQLLIRYVLIYVMYKSVYRKVQGFLYIDEGILYV